jgi:hypothetical protein
MKTLYGCIVCFWLYLDRRGTRPAGVVDYKYEVEHITCSDCARRPK